MLLKMTRVQVIGTRKQLDATIAELHRLGVLHIEDATKSSALSGFALDETSLRLQEELAFLAARLDALIQLLPEAPAPKSDREMPRDSRELAAYVRGELDRIAPTLQTLAQKRDELNAESVSLPRYEATLRKLTPLAVELRELSGYDTAALLLDRRYRDVLDLIRVAVERITHTQFEIIARDVDERTTAALLVYPRAFSGQVQAVLGQENITQVRLPKELAGRTFRDALAALQQRQYAIHEELARVQDQLETNAREWREPLVAWRREIKNRLQELATRSRFGTTEYAFVVEGWAPHRDLSRLRDRLARQVGEQVIVHELGIAEHEHAPVALENPAPMKPFEMFVRMMALPRYGAFDPTPIMAVFLPLFFGIMLGDVAYGALLLLLVLYVKRRYAENATIRDLAQILIYGAIWAIVFGFLYGEFLGTLGHVIGLKPLWMPREGEKILALFAFSIGLGVVQVVMGLLLGLWEAWRERQRGEIAAKIGMLIVLCAIFGMIGVATNFVPRDFFTPSVVILLLGIVLLVIPAGPMGLFLGPLEVVETVGNILSYLRLAAIGLSSVYLALVANEMAGLIGNILIGGILALLLHALNFALGVLSPTIQSLRLHYVEFFRQFYHGGGQEYRPFRIE